MDLRSRGEPLSLPDQVLRDRVRWQLRALVEPAFLRLYLEEDPAGLRALEDAFFSLEPDTERPEDRRRDAWQQLETWVARWETPAAWFCAILRGLRGEHARIAGDLGRFWVLGELFDDLDGAGHPSTAQLPAEPRADHHEIHCHLRGGVPFLTLWRGFIDSDRQRALLRRERCEAGTWQRTWAELVAAAVQHRAESLSLVSEPKAPESAHVRSLVQHLLGADLGDLQAPTQHAVRYLATCAGLSSYLLHQRRTAGLSSFVESYDRYAKLQKSRGSSERQQTRTLVAATLHRFQLDGVAAVELRPTLDRRRSDLQRKLQDVVLGYLDYLAEVPADQPALAIGLVPSLFKQEALPKGGSESIDTAIWSEQQERWADQIRGLLAILDDSPALRGFVVGLDAAGKERGCALGALRPAFALVRDYNRRRARVRPGRHGLSLGDLRELRRSSLSSDDALLKLEERTVSRIRLGVTVHAGEDFEDPLTGLRHIWEAVVDLDLYEGDRIGHALAAGLDRRAIRMLLERRARAPGGDVRQLDGAGFAVRKPRGTHLLDLAWLTRVGRPGECREAALRLGEIAMRTFGSPIDPGRLARDLSRSDAGALARAALPGARFRDPADLGAHDLETVIIDDTWLELIGGMRGLVLRELVQRKIVVESCPTSNLVVANLDRPPLWTFLETPGLRVALATDDPGLLGVFPRAELAPFSAHRTRLIQEAARASFVTCAADPP
jgi:Adenosine deaminase